MKLQTKYDQLMIILMSLNNTCLNLPCIVNHHDKTIYKIRDGVAADIVLLFQFGIHGASASMVHFIPARYSLL